MASSSLVAWRLVVRSAEFVLNAFGLANTLDSRVARVAVAAPGKLSALWQLCHMRALLLPAFPPRIFVFSVALWKATRLGHNRAKAMAPIPIPKLRPTMLSMYHAFRPLCFAPAPRFHHFLNYFSGPDQQTKPTRLGSVQFGLLQLSSYGFCFALAALLVFIKSIIVIGA